MKRLIWFRNDLRIHDNETLVEAAGGPPESLTCVFIYDERGDAVSAENQPRTGAFKKKFLSESVRDLRQSLTDRGQNLLCFYGRPEALIPEICELLKIDQLFYSAQFAFEEREIEAAIARNLDNQKNSHQTKADLRVFSFANHTLIHPKDLSFTVADLPLVFTEFRKRVESSWHVDTPLSAPDRLPPPASDASLVSLAKWNCDDRVATADVASHGFSAEGGEAAGLRRVEEYIWTSDSLRYYKETRNGLLNRNDSSKLSPWLAHGCLSPRSVYTEVRRYEAERVENDSTYWLIFELLWRDYFQFLSLRFGKKLFAQQGLNLGRSSHLPRWSEENEKTYFTAWCEGKTGYPLVDAAMRELRQTGWMQNRVRQNVASFLAHDLAVDWRKGARWFESFLIDYDPCSNWGNWTYVAGVGTDPRARKFNTIKQSQDYDPDGHYVRAWLPELSGLSGSRALTPWQEPLLSQLYQQRLV